MGRAYPCLRRGPRPIIGSRRPDSDVVGDQYRHYEMAGAGHATPDELYYSATSDDIIKAGRTVPPMSCNEGDRSRFPSWICTADDARLLFREAARSDIP